MARHILKIDVALLSEQPFRSSLDMIDLASLSLIDFSMSPIVMSRTQAQANDGQDGFALSVATAGRFVARQAGEELHIHPCEAVLMDSRIASDLANPEAASFWGFKLSRDWFAANGLALPGSKPMKLQASAPLRLLTQYAGGVLASLRLGEGGSHILFDKHLSELLVASLASPGSEGSHRRESIQEARYTAMLDIIRARSTDPTFSLSALGKALGVSERTIQLALADRQTTFSDVLRAHRLGFARAMLEKRLGTSIADVAFAAGFQDLSTFNRAFRAQYGVRPSDVLGHTAQPGRSNARRQ